MNYSEEELKQIEQLASLYMTVSDIAIILDKNAEMLRRDINTKDNPAYDAYRRGKVSSKILLPLALDNVRKALMDMEDDE